MSFSEVKKTNKIFCSFLKERESQYGQTKNKSRVCSRPRNFKRYTPTSQTTPHEKRSQGKKLNRPLVIIYLDLDLVKI